MRLAMRNLLQDKTRFALSVTGIGLAVMLILFLFGLRQGMIDATGAYLRNTDGSIAVLPEGVRSTAAGSGQYLSPGAVTAIGGTEGVAKAIPLLQLRAMPEYHGRKQPVILVGYDPALGGGAWRLTKGREPSADDEVVVDSVIAGRHGFGVGETLELSGRTLKVVGLSEDSISLIGAYIFARKALVESLALVPGSASMVLVTPESGMTGRALIEALQRVPGTTVVPKSEVIANDQEFIASILDQVIILMVAAAFFVGVLVVGMILYTATIERRAEYGVLKAIGAGGSVLYRIVITQAVTAAGAGAILGVLFAFAMGSLVTALKPQFAVTIEPAAIALTLAAGLVMAVLGALVPARSVVHLAPAEVFRR